MSTARSIKSLQSQQNPSDEKKVNVEDKAEKESLSKELYDFIKKMNDKTENPESKVMELMKRGASVNYSHGQGYKFTSPFIYAVHEGYSSLVKIFLEAGADANEKKIPSGWGGYTSPLIIAAQNGDVSTAKILLAHGATLEAVFGGPSDNKTALLYAARDLRAGMVELLINHGANPFHRCNSGLDALEHAERGFKRFIDEHSGDIDSRNVIAKAREEYKKIMECFAPIQKAEAIRRYS